MSPSSSSLSQTSSSNSAYHVNATKRIGCLVSKKLTAERRQRRQCRPAEIGPLTVLLIATTLGSLASDARYAPPSYIRDIDRIFEASEEPPDDWLPVYLLHQNYPTTFRQDFPVYSFVHQFFVSVVSPNSVIHAELLPKNYGQLRLSPIQAKKRVIKGILGESNLWHIFIFKNTAEGTVTVSAVDRNSTALFVEVYGSSMPSRYRESTSRSPFSSYLPPSPGRASNPPTIPGWTPRLPPPMVPVGSTFPSGPLLPSYRPTDRPSWFTGTPYTAFTAPPLLTPRATYQPPETLTIPSTTFRTPIVVIGPGGQVILWPTLPPPLFLPPQPGTGLRPGMPIPHSVLVPVPVAPWAPLDFPLFRKQATSSSNWKLNVFYLALSCAVLAFGTLVLLTTLLVIFCCCQSRVGDSHAYANNLSNAKAGVLFALVVVSALILIIIGIGVVYLHASHGTIQGVWWRPSRLSIAIASSAVFLVFGLTYAVSQFFYTQTYFEGEMPIRPDATIIIVPKRKQAWT